MDESYVGYYFQAGSAFALMLIFAFLAWRSDKRNYATSSRTHASAIMIAGLSTVISVLLIAGLCLNGEAAAAIPAVIMATLSAGTCYALLRA